MTHRSMTARMSALPHLIGTFSTTQTPANGVDVKGLRCAEVCVYVGTITNVDASPGGAGWTFTLQDSDAVSSGFAAVDDTDVVIEDDGDAIASGVFASPDESDEDDKVFHIGYV